MEIDINPPDISHLFRLSAKYANFFSERQLLADVWCKWNELIFSEYPRIFPGMFPTNELHEKCIKDCNLNSGIALNAAWSVGREFAEVYPANAKYCLIINEYGSSLLPDITRKELIDLADYTATLLIILMKHACKQGYLDKQTSIACLEINRKMIREGILLAFKDGVASYYEQ